MRVHKDGLLPCTGRLSTSVLSRKDADGDLSIIDRLVSSFPDDMPDLKEATNHLTPLDLPAQITMFYPDRDDRVGFQVRCHFTDFRVVKKGITSG